MGNANMETLNEHEIIGGSPFFHSSILITILSILTLVLAFGFQVILAERIGAGRDMDAYLMAVTLPTIISTTAQFTFPSVLVPVLRHRMYSGEKSDACQFVNAALNLSWIIGLAITLIIMLAGEPIISIMAPGFDKQKVLFVATLLKIMSIGSLFDILRSVLTAFHYSQERFFPPQFAPSAKHIIMIFCAIVLMKPLGLRGLAWGWTVGSIVMFAMLATSAFKEGNWRFTIHLKDINTGGWASLLIPATLIALQTQFIPLLDRMVASTLTEGSISYLGYGSKILDIMMRTIPMGIVLAIFPIFSQHVGQNNWRKLQRSILSGLRLMLLGVVPIAVMVAALRKPLIILLFQRGAFDQLASENVTLILKWYAVAFIPTSIIYIFNHVFYALKNFRILLKVGILNLFATAALNFILSRYLGFEGIAITNLILAFIFSFILFRLLKTKEIEMDLKSLISWFCKIIFGVLVMLGCIWFCRDVIFSTEFYERPSASGMIVTLIAACAAYILALYVIRIPEIRTALTLLKGRLTKNCV